METIRNSGKELCTKMFTETLFEIAENATKIPGFKANDPK
jgi:hypothetical protein